MGVALDIPKMTEDNRGIPTKPGQPGNTMSKLPGKAQPNKDWKAEITNSRPSWILYWSESAQAEVPWHCLTSDERAILAANQLQDVARTVAEIDELLDSIG